MSQVAEAAVGWLSNAAAAAQAALPAAANGLTASCLRESRLGVVRALVYEHSQGYWPAVVALVDGRRHAVLHSEACSLHFICAGSCGGAACNTHRCFTWGRCMLDRHWACKGLPACCLEMAQAVPEQYVGATVLDPDSMQCWAGNTTDLGWSWL